MRGLGIVGAGAVLFTASAIGGTTAIGQLVGEQIHNFQFSLFMPMSRIGSWGECNRRGSHGDTKYVHNSILQVINMKFQKGVMILD